MRYVGLLLVLVGAVMVTSTGTSVALAQSTPRPNEECRKLVFSSCPSIGDTQCQAKDVCTGSCITCLGTNPISGTKCIFAEGETCPNPSAQPINCGPRYFGTCRGAGSACGCGYSGQPNKVCNAVYGCTPP